MRFKIIAIFIICIVSTLSILDTPEYVHCINPALTGSLYPHAIVFNILKLDIISNAYNITWENFISVLENSIDNKEFFLPLILLSDQLSSVFMVFHNRDSEYPVHPFKGLIEGYLVPKIPELILTGISIIRS